MTGAASELDAILREAEPVLAGARSIQELVELRARFLGKKGSVSGVLRTLGALPPDARAALGAAANRAKAQLEAWADARHAQLVAAGRDAALAQRRLDVTLPGAAAPRGHMHPIHLVERSMHQFFAGLGYSVEDGPEVETDWNNFGALNFPDDHPARDTQDTFFVEGGHVLRTHTSNVQIRAMSGKTPPFRFITTGRVYRPELDATHYPMFHQIEGFCVGPDVSFGDLKGTLYAFARHLFGPGTELRFRAHFFPFTEPSAEMDFRWGERWLEWGGCGMIHPNVLRNCGIDPDVHQGFAFGMALDRPAMDRFGVPSIQLLFDGDVRVLEQF
ncbi:MAG: phenylalanine--tRNA ligase subunit alpha [Myxococcota bacterium]